VRQFVISLDLPKVIYNVQISVRQFVTNIDISKRIHDIPSSVRQFVTSLDAPKVIQNTQVSVKQFVANNKPGLISAGVSAAINNLFKIVGFGPFSIFVALGVGALKINSGSGASPEDFSLHIITYLLSSPIYLVFPEIFLLNFILGFGVNTITYSVLSNTYRKVYGIDEKIHI
ncbi:22690_t:CDS:1, partial [Racocetra persica]